MFCWTLVLGKSQGNVCVARISFTRKFHIWKITLTFQWQYMTIFYQFKVIKKRQRLLLFLFLRKYSKSLCKPYASGLNFVFENVNQFHASWGCILFSCVSDHVGQSQPFAWSFFIFYIHDAKNNSHTSPIDDTSSVTNAEKWMYS